MPGSVLEIKNVDDTVPDLQNIDVAEIDLKILLI